ncbi:MAG: menaquinone biosynthesis protein [Acidobacteria bacterium]|nr:menaquinone biosynthesis protein [Acidobacteriota bacterium]
MIRIGAVGYLNARPLTWALDRSPDRWHIRYDVPSVCSSLLHAGDVDLGLIPSVEYLQAPDYRLVPGVAIGSRGPVASVALFTRAPVGAIRRIALDTSSRTSVALVKVLARHRFRIDPEFVPHGPDLAAMTRGADAALLIGDPALEADHRALGLEKIDLGEEWTAMTGLPFVYAAWTGRPGAVTGADIGALQDAQAAGVTATDAIAAEYARGDAAAAARAAAYLRHNVRYGLGADEARGLQLFLDYAAELGLAPAKRAVRFF